MDNQQAIHWFSGFFEGEGCFTLRKRTCRGNNQGILLEPKVTLSSTSAEAFNICRSILNNWFIKYSHSIDNRKGKLKCYYFDITAFDEIISFTNRLLPYLECDRERCVILNKFCRSRFSRKRYSEINQNEWQLYSRLQQWRASETTREESYVENDDWLAGIYEAEGSFTKHISGQPVIQLCNTNNHIIWKAYQNLLSYGISGHLKRYETGNPNHQPFWHLTLHGRSKFDKFYDSVASNFKFRRTELDWIKI